MGLMMRIPQYLLNIYVYSYVIYIVDLLIYDYCIYI